jgi:hypothetical protein
MLVEISNTYNIDLDQAWHAMIQEGWENLAQLENRAENGEIERKK